MFSINNQYSLGLHLSSSAICPNKICYSKACVYSYTVSLQSTPVEHMHVCAGLGPGSEMPIELAEFLKNDLKYPEDKSCS